MWHSPFGKLGFLFVQFGFFFFHWLAVILTILRIKLAMDSSRQTGLCHTRFLYYVRPAKHLVPSTPHACVFSVCMLSQMASGPWRLPTCHSDLGLWVYVHPCAILVAVPSFPPCCHSSQLTGTHFSLCCLTAQPGILLQQVACCCTFKSEWQHGTSCWPLFLHLPHHWIWSSHQSIPISIQWDCSVFIFLT